MSSSYSSSSSVKRPAQFSRQCPDFYFVDLPVSVWHFQDKKKKPEKPDVTSLSGDSYYIPTRCRDLYLKQFCLEDVAPATLIILIAHIIVAIRWMLIKILSVVINGRL